MQPQGIYIKRFLNRLIVGDGCWRLEGNRASLVPTVTYALEEDFDDRGNYTHCTSAARLSLWFFHRMDWEQMKGLETRHLCDNPWCVRPDHLIIGTRSENQLDRSRPERELKKLRTRSRAHLREVLSRSHL